MMSNDDNTILNRRDDGFRVADAAVDRAVSEVMSVVEHGPVRWRIARWPLVASIALLIGLIVNLSELIQSEPCVTFACQLESLTDEELSMMMEVMDEEHPLILEDEDWPSLY